MIDADALIKILEPHSMRNGAALGWHSGLIDTVIDEIRKMPTIGGWISVKDGLPKKNQIVIVSDGEHTWDVGMYKSLCGKPSNWNWKKNTVKTVLWWMPKDGALPEPPR